MIINQLVISDINFKVLFCKKINGAPINEKFISSDPLVNIYPNEKDNETYILNILSHIPEEKYLKEIIDFKCAGLFLNDKKTLFLGYGGITQIETPVKKDNSNELLCRTFYVDYDTTKKGIKEYDLYHTQIEYQLSHKRSLSAEAVIVHDVNLDPVTDRGTVSTVAW